MQNVAIVTPFFQLFAELSELVEVEESKLFSMSFNTRRCLSCLPRVRLNMSQRFVFWAESAQERKKTNVLRNYKARRHEEQCVTCIKHMDKQINC